MASSLPEYKRKRLERQLKSLLEEHEAVSAQIDATLGAADRLRLQRQAEALEQELDQVQAQLDAPAGAPATGVPAPQAAPATIHIDPDDPPFAALRALLTEAFLPEELRRFCLDRSKFRPVVGRFGSGHGLDDMIDELFDYCRTRLLWDDLAQEVSQARPEQFARFASDLAG